MLIAKFLNKNITKELEDFENSYSINLPQQYKRFLMNYNGGYTHQTKFKVKKVLPIAKDSFGNYIVIGIDVNSEGKIFFADHEKGDNMELIAEDLKAFITCCKSKQIPAEARRTIKEREDALIAKGRGNIITDGLREMWQAEIDKYRDMIQEEVELD